MSKFIEPAAYLGSCLTQWASGAGVKTCQEEVCPFGLGIRQNNYNLKSSFMNTKAGQQLCFLRFA